MKRILSIISFISICFFSSYGQTAVPNGSFESWSNIGTSTEEPQYYHSNKDGGGWATYGPQTCYRDTSTLNGGSYCAKIISGSALGNVVNGACTTGRVEAPTTNKSDGYIRSESTNTGYITSFTGRPDSLVFWYRYTSVSSDYPTVEARLHVDSAYAPETSNSHHASTNYNIIARALWQGGASSVSGWTRVSVPFTYVDSRTPQYIFITSTSSGNQTGGSSGSTLWLDEITAIYNPTVATGTVNTGPYYVSAATGASISVPFTLTGTFNGGNVVTAQLSDAGGSFASPVNIGSATTGTSGAITATIPAGTASGAGYRVRVVTSSPALTAANNGSNIQVIQVGNSVTSASTQTIAANTNGTNLSVTETPAAGSREWKYATTTGGPYTSFGTPQTGTTYTPNFANAGSYYVVCVSNYPGSLTTTSNEVRINVVANSIAPTASQSILVGVNGNMLTVTESPTGTAREWKYATTSGGPYSSFGTAQTTTTYTPNFAGTGTYYVVCVSTISSVAVTSNEVLVSVGNATIATGAITGSPYLFSPHAPDASVSVPYTTSGTFNGGNTFTAQLSDAAGSFASPVNIGSVSATSSGNISASIPHITAAGTGYRIRVVSSSPVVLGSDNGADLAVDQFHNSVAPGSTQAIALNTNGTNITVTESQTATHNWEYSTTSGSGYMNFNPVETSAGYTPNFALPGTYYVVCVSTNQYNDSVTSNEVQVDVANGSTIATQAVSGSPYYVSDSANNIVAVDFTSDAVFNNGNTFTAQLSDNNGNFTNAVNIGTLNAASVGTISALIPNNSVAGTHYRIRVVSSNPVITGSDNGSDLTIIPFEISVAPLDTQRLAINQSGNTLMASSTHPVSAYRWQWALNSGLSYSDFSPVQTEDTLSPHFASAHTYYVVCKLTNAQNATITSQEVVVMVTQSTGVSGVAEAYVKAYWNGNDFVVDMSNAKLQAPAIEMVNVTGQQIISQKLVNGAINRISNNLPAGLYLFRITDGSKVYCGKSMKLN